MHKYLRAIGFSEVKKRDALQGLINEVVEKTILRRNKTENGKEKNLEEITRQMKMTLYMRSCFLTLHMAQEFVCAASLMMTIVFYMIIIFLI